jgi:hypothetical protein
MPNVSVLFSKKHIFSFYQKLGKKISIENSTKLSNYWKKIPTLLHEFLIYSVLFLKTESYLLSGGLCANNISRNNKF